MLWLCGPGWLPTRERRSPVDCRSGRPSEGFHAQPPNLQKVLYGLADPIGRGNPASKNGLVFCRNQAITIAEVVLPLSFRKRKWHKENICRNRTPRGDAACAQATIPPRQVFCKIKEIEKVEAELNARRAVLPACRRFRHQGFDGTRWHGKNRLSVPKSRHVCRVLYHVRSISAHVQ